MKMVACALFLTAALAAGIPSATGPSVQASPPPYELRYEKPAEHFSQGGEIRLLPTLPAAWPSGSVRGLRARGGVEVDLTWQAGVLHSVTLRTTVSGAHRIAYGDAGRTAEMEAGEEIRLDGNLKN